MATLRDYCAQLDQHLSSIADPQERIATAAKSLAKVFRVREDEVALFKLKDETVLNFLWPLKLQKVGFIPLNSHDSLAARTVRENQAFLHNDFSSARHTGVFEIVHLEKGKGKPQPIQKILSAPLTAQQDAYGAVQISRKGESDTADIPNFSDQDLEQLKVLCGVIEKHIHS
ncbi:MAG: hypothetical protein C0624_01100 [Desulfuromonas sp.]|nr:MAG: hypothetical protein C0624_01100 [Desulfuromonas sp.]